MRLLLRNQAKTASHTDIVLAMLPTGMLLIVAGFPFKHHIGQFDRLVGLELQRSHGQSKQPRNRRGIHLISRSPSQDYDAMRRFKGVQCVTGHRLADRLEGARGLHPQAMVQALETYEGGTGYSEPVIAGHPHAVRLA
jgi:hypothetical protein